MPAQPIQPIHPTAPRQSGLGDQVQEADFEDVPNVERVEQVLIEGDREECDDVRMDDVENAPESVQTWPRARPPTRVARSPFQMNSRQ